MSNRPKNVGVVSKSNPKASQVGTSTFKRDGSARDNLSSQSRRPSQDESSYLPKYQLEPPSDLLPLHKRVKLGYPGMNPQTADQNEDILSPDRIRGGYFEKYLCKNECALGVDTVYDQLTDRSKLASLGSLLCSAIAKQHLVTESQFVGISPEIEKISISEEAKSSWLSKVTDPIGFSIEELSLAVPHGLRMESIIKSCADNECNMSQAVWLIRLFALSDQHGKGLTVANMLSEWTAQFIRVMGRAMTDLLKIPSGDGALDKYLRRLNYCTRLVEQLYAQDLLDQKQFLRWLVEAVGSSPAKCAFLVPVVMNLLSEFARSRALSLMLIRALSPYCEAAATDAFSAYCRGIIEAMLLQTPDVFVLANQRQSSASPDWESLLATPPYAHQRLVYLSLGISPTRGQIKKAISNIIERNQRFVAPPIIVDSLTSAKSQPYRPVNPFEEFGAITVDTDIIQLVQHIFKKITPKNTDQLDSAIQMLLNWAAYYGDLDLDIKYLVSTLLKIWASASSGGSEKTDSTARQEAIEGSLLRFLEQWEDTGGSSSSEEKRNEDEKKTRLDNLLDTFGQLTRRGIFSFSRYLMRAIARGYLDHNQANPTTMQRHVTYLRSLPAYAADETFALHRQSNLTLPNQLTSPYDFKTEQSQLAHFLEIAKQHLPKIMGETSHTSQVAPVIDDSSNPIPVWDSDFLDQLSNSTRFVKGEIVALLITGVMNYVIKDVTIGEDNWRFISKPGTALISVREFCQVAILLDTCQEIGALLELSIWVFINTEERTLVPVIIDVFTCYQSTIIASGFTSMVVGALWTKHREFKSSVNHLDKPTLFYLLNQCLATACGTSSDMRSELELNLQSLIVHPTNLSGEIPEYVPELYDLPSDAGTLRSRAASLCMRYRTIPGWWGKLFFNTTQLIHHRITSGTESGPGGASRLLQMLRNYSDLFRFLADFSLEPTSVVLDWARSILPATSRLGPEVFGWYMVYLALLVTRAICPMTTILALINGLLEPIVQVAIKDSVVPPQLSEWALFKNGYLLLLRLLLITDNSRPLIFGEVCAGPQDTFVLRLLRQVTFRKVDNLDIVFQLLYQLTILESSIGSAQQQYQTMGEDLQQFRIQLSQSSWLIKFGLVQYEPMYHRFMREGGYPLRFPNANEGDELDKEEVSEAGLEIGGALSNMVVPKLIMCFLTILGQSQRQEPGEGAGCLIKSTLTSSKLAEYTTEFQFKRNLTLISLSLDQLLLPDNSVDTFADPLLKYVAMFFQSWVFDAQVPLPLLVQATTQAAPFKLGEYFISHALNLLSGPSLEDGKCSDLNFVGYMYYKLRDRVDQRVDQEDLIHQLFRRFQLVIQSLLRKVNQNIASMSDDDIKKWRKVQLKLGTQLFKELELLVSNIKVLNWMVTDNCTFYQAQKRNLASLHKDKTAPHASNKGTSSSPPSLTPNHHTTVNAGKGKEGDAETGMGEVEEKEPVSINLVRQAIHLRLELLIPILSHIINDVEPEMRQKWIKSTLNLVVNPILDPTSSLFEFGLDFFSFLVGELTKEAKADAFSTLRVLQASLPLRASTDQRILRLFPFEALTKLPPAAGDSINPWEWDRGLVRGGSPTSLPKHLCLFQPYLLNSTRLFSGLGIPSKSGDIKTDSVINDLPPLLESHHLEPPPQSNNNHGNSSVSISTLPRSLSRLSSSNLPHSYNHYRTTASPLSTYRATQSPRHPPLATPSPRSNAGLRATNVPSTSSASKAHYRPPS